MEMLLTYGLAMVMASPRLLGLHLSLPMFSQGVIPNRVRSGLSLSLGLFVMPMILAQGQPPSSLIAFAGIALKEFFLGFAFGFPIALYNFAAQSAGDMISFQSGASMSAFFDPASHEEITPMGNLLKRYAEVLFFISGAYMLMLGALFESYRIWPVGSYVPNLSSAGADFWGTALGHYFAAACMLAFPALACMFLITFCMGLIGRYLPQLNVFFVAMPLQCLAACLVMILSFPIYAHLFKAHFAGIDDGLATLWLVFGKH
jgi:type III secretion protein T